MRTEFRIATVILLCGVCGLWAQTPTATLVGVVTDPTGAAVPAAHVEIRNSATNEIRKQETNQRGEFTVPDLLPGTYDVSITKDGFRTLHESRIELEVEQQARMEYHLQMGSVSEKVEVMASAPLVNTENGEKGDVMVAAEIVEMPLDGRDFTNLGLLTPGAVTGLPQGGFGSFASISGARADNTTMLVDGDNNRSAYGGAAISHPSIDSIQEFKIETSGYSAEFGRMAGGVVNVVLKSGGNQIHGAAFEFLRNNVLNARNFFATTIPPYRRNQFGGMLSGPVYIPKLYNGRNRTFFLFSMESYRQAVGSSALAAVPTVALTQGNFAGLAAIKDPLNGNAAFPGNQIPMSRISPSSLKAEAYYPTPNYPGANNFYSAPLTPTNWDNPEVKIDQVFGPRDSVSFRYLERFDRAQAPAAFGNWGTNRPDQQLFFGLNYTHTFAPTVINEARAGYTYSPTRTTPFDQGTNYNAVLGMSGGPTDPKLWGFPEITIAGYAQIGPAFQQPNIYAPSAFDESDTLTWVKGAHLIKFGGDVIHNVYNQLAANNSRGTYNFAATFSGNAYADFLLGYLNSDTITLGATPVYLRNTDFGLFFQDDWKIARNLTLNLGLRYELPRPTYDKYGRWSTFDPQLNKIVVTSLQGAVPGATFANASTVETAQQAGLPSSLVPADNRDIAPRIGFAWRPFGGNQTVLRGGYGIFYGGNELIDQETFASLQFPWVVPESLNRNLANPNALTLANPFPTPPTLTGSQVTVYGMNLNAPTPYEQSWNMTVERDIGFSSAIEIGYVGSHGTHWDRMSNLNQPYRSAATNPNFPVPYPGWGSINLYDFWGNSSYNALNATWRRRFANNFFYRIGYNYAKSLDDASRQGDNNNQPQNARNWKADYGRSEYDFGHSFLMSFSWQAPRSYNIFLRGWQIAGTGIAHTGPPFTPSFSGANLALGEASRPNRVCNGSLPNPTPTHWFNASCFPVVPDGSFAFGNSGRDILDGPGQIAFNVAFSRNFAIREKANLQFRWETFNVLNHANFPLPVATVNTATAGTITSANDPRTMQGALRFTF